MCCDSTGVAVAAGVVPVGSVALRPQAQGTLLWPSGDKSLGNSDDLRRMYLRVAFMPSFVTVPPSMLRVTDAAAHSHGQEAALGFGVPSWEECGNGQPSHSHAGCCAPLIQDCVGFGAGAIQESTSDISMKSSDSSRPPELLVSKEGPHPGRR